MVRPPSRAGALVGGNNGIPYDAADFYSDHMAGWWPYLTSPDGALNSYRDTIVARVRDIVRNDGWASGTITRILDSAVGANFRPISKPDFSALASYSGIRAFDESWAYEYGRWLDAAYRSFALRRGRWNDLSRKLTLPQQYRLGFRHKLVDGDALAMLHWRPDRIGPGRSHYATTLQIIDPDRLSNPVNAMDQRYMRGGVELDQNDDGIAVAYHIRRAHQNDVWAGADSMAWDRIPRETDWGRPIIVHDYDHEQAAAHRGGAGILAPVLHRLRMLFQYDVAELDASLLNAIFSAYIESPFDQEFVEGALNGADALNAYQAERAEYHRQNKLKAPGTGASMTKLFPGEKLGQVTTARPNANFKEFEAAVLRNVASAAGVSTQQVTNNWSDVNYSSHQGALQEFFKTLSRRRDDYANGFCQPIREAFVEEAMDLDDPPLPVGAPEFFECADAYARAKWIGPPRGWTNPVDEVKGAVLGMDAALMDYEELCAEQGLDAADMIAARKHTIRRFEEAGIPLPTWSGMNPQGEPANRTIKDPEAT
ncbi:phage portal protein [Sphingomonas sp. CBMAI 2297]|uniref:phage portal protein n=1 Tax=Sphingomonas sp. CBMAI 2297 TaxID=2991720 RepID=UPI0024589C26|nr:phage portal protein [Sphingomonas sp. CBMAI 2297]MDH4745833.1 phage portal protein [Sphingomonas sp. CBMAI 2297]